MKITYEDTYENLIWKLHMKITYQMSDEIRGSNASWDHQMIACSHTRTPPPETVTSEPQLPRITCQIIQQWFWHSGDRGRGRGIPQVRVTGGSGDPPPETVPATNKTIPAGHLAIQIPLWKSGKSPISIARYLAINSLTQPIGNGSISNAWYTIPSTTNKQPNKCNHEAPPLGKSTHQEPFRRPKGKEGRTLREHNTVTKQQALCEFRRTFWISQRIRRRNSRSTNTQFSDFKIIRTCKRRNKRLGLCLCVVAIQQYLSGKRQCFFIVWNMIHERQCGSQGH